MARELNNSFGLALKKKKDEYLKYYTFTVLSSVRDLTSGPGEFGGKAGGGGGTKTGGSSDKFLPFCTCMICSSKSL